MHGTVCSITWSTGPFDTCRGEKHSYADEKSCGGDMVIYVGVVGWVYQIWIICWGVYIMCW